MKTLKGNQTAKIETDEESGQEPGPFGESSSNLELVAPQTSVLAPDPSTVEADDEEIRILNQIGENPFEHLSPTPHSRVKQIWATGGGKGGVGKSLISSSLALTLARNGHKTIAVDLDLGAANLHTLLGIELPRQTLSDFLSDRSSLEACITKTGIPNLELISGAQDAVGVANLQFSDKVKILQKLRQLDADYVMVDLGAGTSYNTIDFFLYADMGLITLLPEPTSIENGYRFIKSAYYRRLLVTKSLAPVHHLIRMAMDHKNTMGIRTPGDLYRAVQQFSPDSALKLKEEIERFRPKLIINQARTQSDIDIGFSVKSVCKKYFGIEMDYIGYLDYDSAVWQAIRRKRPMLIEFPNSRIVSSLERIANFLIKRYGHNRNQFF